MLSQTAVSAVPTDPDEKRFDRVVVISLPRRRDRLDRFQAAIATMDWPLPQPEVFDAVDGSRLPTPLQWRCGQGAWGCLQSHRNVLERALLDGQRSVLVFEDDACFRSTFADELKQFLGRVPDDWDGLMLGGQHLSRPVEIGNGVVRCVDCHRTHAYAARGRFLRDLYQIWVSQFGHCDAILGPFASQYNVYAPDPFIVGQDGGRSDIAGTALPTRYWIPPSSALPITVLHVPRRVSQTLRRFGFYFGKHSDRIEGDLLLHSRTAAKPSDQKLEEFSEWLAVLRAEAANVDHRLPAIFANGFSADSIRAVSSGPVIEINEQSAAGVISALPHEARQVIRPRLPYAVVLLRCPQQVIRELPKLGFYSGDAAEGSGELRGLAAILKLPSTAHVDCLRVWLRQLIAAAESRHAVAAVVHPGVGLDLLERATDRPVLELEAGTPDEVQLVWATLTDRQQ
jgi:hypothetical protein